MLTKLWGCRLDLKLNEFNRHSNYLVGAGMISCEDDDCAESAICRANRYYESALLHYYYYEKRLHRGNCHSGAV